MKGALTFKRPTAADAVSHRNIEEVDLVFLLGVLCDPLRLLHITDEVPERILPAVANIDRPLSRGCSTGEEPVDARENSGAGSLGAVA